MKRLICLLILLLCPFAVNAASGSVSVNPRSLNIVKGSSANITLSYNNVAGSIDVTNSNSSIASISASNFFVDTSLSGTSDTLTVTGLNVGSTTITIKLTDVATFADEELTGEYKVTVNVTEPAPAPTQAPVQQTTTKKANTGTVVIPPTIEQPTEPVTEPITETIIDITKFQIVGYDINFNKDVFEYTIDVYNTVKELYLIVEGNEIEVSQGLISIDGKDSITVPIKKNDKELIYTIKINRITNENNSTVPTQDTSSSYKGLKISIIVVSVVLLIETLVSAYYFILSKKSI